MKKLTILFLLSTFFTCQSDKEEYFFLDKYGSMDIGDGKETFVYNSKEKWNFDTIIIYSDVAKYGENNDYIIALQKPNKN